MNLRRQRNDEVSINLTPLIDVVFLLLIFFMVSTTFKRERELEVALPKASPAPSGQTGPAPLEMVVTAGGDYFLANEPVPGGDVAALRQALADVVAARRDVVLVIRADKDATHQAVVRVLDAAGQVGLYRVQIPTEVDPGGG
jgi:biopolymer transport protein ExbD